MLVARRKAVRISVLLVVAYIVCWLPYNALSLWQLFDPVGYAQYEYIHFLHGLIVFNSVINPFLYGMFGGQLKRFTRTG